ncbi:MAG: hypothetical protein GC168_11300 [Candidatus Hydrogenedens sp.]|nr:hypothetical protein [Candidatus Hydrogenedens sp.]
MMETDAYGKKVLYVEPGHSLCTNEPVILKAVVGSCVVVCLYELEMQFGGMAHFKWPLVRDPSSATTRYGNVATGDLIRMMLEAGGEAETLRAQIIGGAAAGPGEEEVGKDNVSAARGVLERAGIPIASEDVGGLLGRKVAFDVTSGQVAVLKVHQLRESDWLRDAESVD